MKKFALDISPLRKYRELRLLFASGMITRLGSAMTMVALPFQIKILTNSYVAVGLMGLVQLVPLIIFGLYGGVLADAVDRKKMILLAEAASGDLPGDGAAGRAEPVNRNFLSGLPGY